MNDETGRGNGVDTTPFAGLRPAAVALASVLLLSACGGTGPVAPRAAASHVVSSDTPIWAADMEFVLGDPNAKLLSVTGVSPLGMHAARQLGDRVIVAYARTGAPSERLLELRFDRPTELTVEGLAAFGETAESAQAKLVVAAVPDEGRQP